MRIGRLVGTAWVLSAGLLASAPALAQELALTRDCEAGFRQLIDMAQTGRLGADVTNANVGIFNDHVRLELLRPGAPMKLLLLTDKRSAHTVSRYFDVTPRAGATAADAARVGAALDEVFKQDPFEIQVYEGFSGATAPGLAEAWEYGGWRAVVRAGERRMIAYAGLPYTSGVIVALTLTWLVSLVVLWGSLPPRDRGVAP
jgi:hypothetical protein